MKLALIFVAMGLGVLPLAGAPQKVAVDIFIASTADGGFVNGATVAVQYDGGSQSEEAQSPHARARFTLPASAHTLLVTVQAEGYHPLEVTLALSGKTQVGGQGFTLLITPL
jgi:hypothetical protein